MPLTTEETSPLWTAEELQQRAGHPHPEVRLWALERIKDLYPEAFRDQLLVALRDTDWQVVSSALGWLPRALDPELRALLQDLLKRKGLPKRMGANLRNHLSGRALVDEDSEDDAEQDADGEVDEEEIQEAKIGQELKALAADPEGLRAYADKVFREGEPSRFFPVLNVLRARPERWASALILEHLARLQEHEGDMVWEILAEIGDPRAIAPGLAHHRPGETSLASSLALIARIAGRENELPALILQESKDVEARIQGLMEDEEIDFLNAKMRPFKLRCLRCRKVGSYDVGEVFMDPEVSHQTEKEWDGVVFGRIIVCKWCSAQDDYELTNEAYLTLSAFTLQAVMSAKYGGKSPLTMQALGLWDGTRVRRPSWALEHLEALVARDPSCGEAWRRLGNLREKYEQMDGAVDAWKEAIARDGREAEACYSLSTHYQKIDPEAAAGYARELMRRQAKQPGEWPLRVEMLAESLAFLAEQARKQRRPLGLRVIPAGAPEAAQTIDLLSLRDLSVLGVLFEGNKIPELELTEEVQPGALGPLKGHPRFKQLFTGRVVPVRTEAKVGRNDPCPCGSGKKYKKCCGA